jgi:hypothetical protein
MPKVNSISSLSQWLNGQETLRSFRDGTRLSQDNEFGAWIALEEVTLAHQAHSVPAQSLIESWSSSHTYAIKALSIVSEYYRTENPEDVYLEHEERNDIIHRLGNPPKPCFPIYIFSVDDGVTERAVYVGKTNSFKGRFSGGHSACVKLLEPKYSSFTKRLYLCQVMFLSQSKQYLPLEWIKPYETAKKFLDDAESDLIFRLQPELNSLKKKNNISNSKIDFMVVNHTDRKSFIVT